LELRSPQMPSDPLPIMPVEMPKWLNLIRRYANGPTHSICLETQQQPPEKDLQLAPLHLLLWHLFRPTWKKSGYGSIKLQKQAKGLSPKEVMFFITTLRRR